RAVRPRAVQVVLGRLAFAVVDHHGPCHGSVVAVGPVEAALDPQRCQHQTVHQQVEALAGDALHDLGDEREVEVGVAEVPPGRVLAVPRAGIGEDVPYFAAERRLPVAGGVGQAGTVREQQAQGDRLIRERRVAEFPAQVAGDIRIQVELAGLDQAHHANRGHQLGDRGDAHRVARGDLAAGGDIGQAFDMDVGDAVAVEGDADAGHRSGGEGAAGG